MRFGQTCAAWDADRFYLVDAGLGSCSVSFGWLRRRKKSSTEWDVL